jgi:hypothetical protein
LPAAEGARYRAEAQLSAAESAFQAASSPAAIASAEEAKARALARRADAEAQLVAARAEAPLKAAAAARAREEARVAEVEKVAALNAATEAAQMMSPASIFISRKTQRLYVRQAFQQVFEGPVTIREAGQPIGTHIYTALNYTNDGANVRWSAVSTSQSPDGRQRDPHNGSGRGKGRNFEPTSPGTELARAALDRVEIPNDIVDRISEIISPQSSLIISDEGMSAETGKDTDFVILLSGAPQGGVKMRRHDPQAHNRRDDWHDRAYERSGAYAPSFYGGGAFDPW